MTAKKFYYVLIAILILSLASIVGAFYIGNQQLQAESDRISELLADRDVTREKIVRLQKAQNDTEDLSEIESLLDNLLPREKQQDELIANIIYTATAEAGIPFNKISSFTFSGGDEPNDLSGTVVSETNPSVYEYPFSLQIEEITYETLLQLLREIEQNGRLVQVDNVQISPDTTDPNIVSATLSTKAFVKP